MNNIYFLSDLIVIPFLFVLLFAAWRVDSGKKVIFSAFLLIMVSQFRQNIPSAFILFHRGLFDNYLFVLYTCLAFLSLILGFLWYTSRIKNYRLLCQQYRAKPFIISPQFERRNFFGVLIFMAILLFLGFLLYRGFPPVIQTLSDFLKGMGDTDSIVYVGVSREKLTKGYLFGQESYRGQGVLRSIMHNGWPMLSGFTFVMYFLSRQRKWLITLGVVLACSFIFIAGDGTRAAYIQYWLMIIVLYTYMREVKIKFALKSAVLIFIALILLSLYSPKLGMVESASSAIKSIIDRIILGNTINDFYAMELLDKGTIQYRFGSLHWRDIRAAMPGVGGELPFAYELFEIIYPHLNATTYLTGTYITKTYVDFGILGTILSYFCIGSFVGYAQQKLYGFRKTPLSFVLVTMLLFTLGTITEVGPVGVLPTFIIIYCLYKIFGFFLKFG